MSIDKQLDLSEIPKLNPIYYEQKAIKLFGRNRVAGKLLKKSDKKPSSNMHKLHHEFDQEGKDGDESDDDNDGFHEEKGPQYDRNIHDDMSSMNSQSQGGFVEGGSHHHYYLNKGTYRNKNMAEKYRKKHFSKVFTVEHPGIPEKLLRKYNVHLEGGATI